MRADNLTPFGEGDFCLVLLSGDRLVRVAKHAEAAAAIQREACVLPVIADHLPLPVPRLAYHEQPDCPPYTLHSLVAGQALSRKTWEGFSEADRDATAAQLAAFLQALHGIAPETVRQCGLPAASLGDLLDRIGPPAEASVLPRLSDDSARMLERSYEDWSSRPDEPSAGAILHCDVDPGHVLVSATTRRLSGVIDFGDLSIGDPARDFIFIYEDFGSAMLDIVLQHYRREQRDSLIPRIHAWYVFDLISWILTMVDQHNEAEVARGVRLLTSELGAMTV